MKDFTHIFETGNQLLLVNGLTRAFAYPTTGGLWLVEYTPDATSDGFLWPFDPDGIDSEWGLRIPPPVTGIGTFHSGCDWSNADGTPIKAAGDGVVLQVRTELQGGGPGGASWGNRVVIDHGTIGGDKLYTGYAHMRSSDFPMVGEGDPIAAGQVIGSVGTTGASSGDHLHFATFIGGLLVGNAANPLNSVNPRDFMAVYNPLGAIA